MNKNFLTSREEGTWRLKRLIEMLANRESSIILIIGILSGSVSGYFVTRWLLKTVYQYQVPAGIIPMVAGALLIFTVGTLVTSFSKRRSVTRDEFIKKSNRNS